MSFHERKQGDRVRIVATDNPFARSHIGKCGTVVGFMGELLVLDLDDGTRDFWAFPRNVSSADVANGGD